MIKRGYNNTNEGQHTAPRKEDELTTLKYPLLQNNINLHVTLKKVR